MGADLYGHFASALKRIRPVLQWISDVVHPDISHSDLIATSGSIRAALRAGM
jgi:hypothetical protein